MGTRWELVSSSPESTRALGAALGRLLQPGDFIGVTGPLGAGKTELVRGIAEGAEVSPDQVSSPTFAILSTYRGRLTLHHADLYRIADERELYATGYYDLGDEGALVVEWVERVRRAAPREGLSLTLEPLGESTRRIRVEAEGDRPRALLDAWRLTAPRDSSAGT